MTITTRGPDRHFPRTGTSHFWHGRREMTVAEVLQLQEHRRRASSSELTVSTRPALSGCTIVYDELRFSEGILTIRKGRNASIEYTRSEIGLQADHWVALRRCIEIGLDGKSKLKKCNSWASVKSTMAKRLRDFFGEPKITYFDRSDRPVFRVARPSAVSLRYAKKYDDLRTGRDDPDDDC